MSAPVTAVAKISFIEWVHKALQAAWPVLSVILIVILLLSCSGTGWFADIETWPTIKSVTQQCGTQSYCPDYVRIFKYYSIISFGTASFLFLNATSFIFSVQKISQKVTNAQIDSNLTRDLAVYLRFFALIPNMIWLVKIALIPEGTFGGIYLNEKLVLFTFIFCALADGLILCVLWRQKDGKLWLENREFFGVLCYIDIPTLFGIFLLVRYAPMLLDGTTTPDYIMKALAGGALIIHVVTSQIILSFLITEAKFSGLIERHWQSALAAPAVDKGKK
jgi:hypothetical protein